MSYPLWQPPQETPHGNQVGYYPGCVDLSCSCQNPQPVCDAFQKVADWPWCAECGWVKSHHLEK